MPLCITHGPHQGERCPLCEPILELLCVQNASGLSIDRSSRPNRAFTFERLNECLAQATPKEVLEFALTQLEPNSCADLDHVLCGGLDHYSNRSTLIRQACEQLQNRCFRLGPAYTAFCAHEESKKHLAECFRTQFATLKQRYRATKRELIELLLENTKPTQSHEINWRNKVEKLLASNDRSKPHYDLNIEGHPLANEHWFVVNVNGYLDWFKAMITLSTVRKVLSEKNRVTAHAIKHLTVLNWEHFCVIAFNYKDKNSGTTRMLWPLTRPDTTLESYNRLRVADMSYSDVYKIIRDVLLPNCPGPPSQTGKDSILAQYILGVLNNEEGIVNQLLSIKSGLGSITCSFIYGLCFDGNSLKIIDSKWNLSKRARASKDLNHLGIEVTLYEAICYILSIILLAEPRHSLGMWQATIRSIELVNNGFLTFEQLFGSLNGAIQHGRLLPGANVLSSTLNARVSLNDVLDLNKKCLARGLDDNQLPPIVVDCRRKPKRLAMPLVDSLLCNEEPDIFPWDVAVALNHNATDPMFQPLIKVLFIEFLSVVTDHAETPYKNAQEFLEMHKAMSALINPPSLRPPPKERFHQQNPLLWAPEGWSAWDVEHDSNSFSRALALLIEKDWNKHGAIRLQAADQLLSEFYHQEKIDDEVKFQLQMCLTGSYRFSHLETMKSIVDFILNRLVKSNEGINLDIPRVLEICQQKDVLLKSDWFQSVWSVVLRELVQKPTELSGEDKETLKVWQRSFFSGVEICRPVMAVGLEGVNVPFQEMDIHLELLSYCLSDQICVHDPTVQIRTLNPRDINIGHINGHYYLLLPANLSDEEIDLLVPELINASKKTEYLEDEDPKDFKLSDTDEI